MHYYSLHGGKISSAQGAEISTLPLAQASPEGVMVLPGGRGTRSLINEPEFLKALRKLGHTATYVLSICTGSAVLAKAGLLDGKKATSNKAAFNWVMSISDKVNWQKKARWVTDGKFYTSSGVSAGIDMTLGFIADLYGIDEARKIACHIEYLWNEDKETDPFCC